MKIEGQVFEVAGHRVKYDGTSDWGAELGILDAFTILTPGMQTSFLMATNSSDRDLEAVVLDRVALFKSYSRTGQS